MDNTLETLKILLLQIREDSITKSEEWQEFIRFSGLRTEQIETLNVFDTPHFTPEIMNNYHALFIGGSSDATVRDPITYPFVGSCKKLIRFCYDQQIPVLASCFGFQLAVEEFGGKVELDAPQMEMGLYQIALTEFAKEDLLLHDTRNQFWAVSGHKERATQLPQEAVLLGQTALCPYHIFTFADKPFYAFQFHPEVDTQDLITRITRYQQRYSVCNNTLQSIIDTAIHQTTESNDIIRKFVERVILKQTGY